VAFGGVDDQEFSRADVQAWREQTNAEFDLWMLPGDHFFIHDSQERILGILAQDLFKRMPRQRSRPGSE
jgi:medium-chain acyl-[acyl-carrier-protein] hydrolase